MIRINFGIPPTALTDQALLREHSDLRKLPTLYSQRLTNGKGFEDIPEDFTFGKGHAEYFYDKPVDTLLRYSDIYMECLRRGLKVRNYAHNWNKFRATKKVRFQEVKITNKQKDEVIIRLKRRIYVGGEAPTYCGKEITTLQAVEMLNEYLSEKNKYFYV